jgi:hypothetical protein
MGPRAHLVASLCLLFAACPPAGAPDAGMDSGVPEPEDAGFDAGQPDAGPIDSGVPDAGLPDAGPPDAGPVGDGGCVYRLDPFSGTWSTARPLALELADLNDDGHLDFVLATTSTIEVRLNDGQGGFVAPSLLGPLTAQTLSVTDVDGDGQLDVVAVDLSGVLTFLHGNGDGTLTLGERLDAGLPFFVPLDTALADLDGDGRSDFVTVEIENTVPELRVVRGTFDGGPVRKSTGSHRLLLADVTGDGFIDALMGIPQYGLVIRPGDGDGGFDPRTDAGALFLASTAVNSLALTDVTGDGVPDAVCASGYYDGTLTSGGGVSVLAGLDGGGFSAPAAEPSGREIVWGLVLADLNRDGLLDAVTTRLGLDAGLEVLAGADGGTFSSLRRVPGRNGWSVAVGDLNEDGWPDVVVGSGAGSNGEVRVLLGSCQ